MMTVFKKIAVQINVCTLMKLCLLLIVVCYRFITVYFAVSIYTSEIIVPLLAICSSPTSSWFYLYIVCLVFSNLYGILLFEIKSSFQSSTFQSCQFLFFGNQFERMYGHVAQLALYISCNSLVKLLTKKSSIKWQCALNKFSNKSKVILDRNVQECFIRHKVKLQNSYRKHDLHEMAFNSTFLVKVMRSWPLRCYAHSAHLSALIDTIQCRAVITKYIST